MASDAQEDKQKQEAHALAQREARNLQNIGFTRKQAREVLQSFRAEQRLAALAKVPQAPAIRPQPPMVEHGEVKLEKARLVVPPAPVFQVQQQAGGGAVGATVSPFWTIQAGVYVEVNFLTA